ncbi:hypothetical protein POX_a01734 [Penicillium oxalicum]|uniref:hypothetical protein n=1 Tax=Penicillium oxalicum TaxID=69781 RepID=UPI0020B89E7C|nr:hypothetical protein POX_a01734 [Penicillium oxalicum]KAI2795129.1 hypothetical protein POX_a01734 [Penicillium oxalicum]
MATSAKEQAKAQGQEDTRNPDMENKPSEANYWSGIQPRYMSVEQEKDSQYDLEDLGKPEMLNRNRLLRQRPQDPNEYTQGPVEG